MFNYDISRNLKLTKSFSRAAATLAAVSAALAVFSGHVYGAQLPAAQDAAVAEEKMTSDTKNGTKLTADTAAASERINKILAGMTLEEKAGQMVIADFRNWRENPKDNSAAVNVTDLPEAVKEAIRNDYFGGIILFAENCTENDKTLALVNQMQLANAESGRANPIPLLIAIDQEGGAVTRLGEGTVWPGNMALAATGDPANAKTAAYGIGTELKALGINTDFAPVVDVNNDPRNPVIGVRSFSDDPAVVREYGVSFLAGLQESGTISSLKHFPGHGDVETDSHTGFPVVDKTYDELKKCELIPFQAAIDAGADMVMTAHIQYPKIDNRTYTSISTGGKVYYPATLSDKILKDILRKDMGFEGVIVSDALNMAAIADNFALEDVTLMALNAGIDMFLMPVPVNDRTTLAALEAFIHGICEKVADGTIPESRLDESVLRILEMKEKHGLLDERYVPSANLDSRTLSGLVGSSEYRGLDWELCSKSITLLKNENDVLPLKPAAGETVLFLYTAASRIASADYARQRLIDEGILSGDVTFNSLVCSADTAAECEAAVSNADYVVAVSTVFGTSELNPTGESGKTSALLDSLLQKTKAENKPFVLISTYLPYDAARYPGADAILLTFGSKPLRALPEGNASVGLNIPAAVCGIFGEYEFSGRLPVDIPALDSNYQLTDEILYHREISHN